MCLISPLSQEKDIERQIKTIHVFLMTYGSWHTVANMPNLDKVQVIPATAPPIVNLESAAFSMVNMRAYTFFWNPKIQGKYCTLFKNSQTAR
jgi:hypothetical protein